MNTNYKPIEHEGGASYLPYKLVPPVKNGGKSTMFGALRAKSGGSFWGLITRNTLRLATLVAGVYLYLRIGDSDLFKVIVTSLVFYYFASRPFKATVPKILWGMFGGLFVILLFPAEYVLVAILMLTLTVIQGFRLRFKAGFEGSEGLATLQESMQSTWGIAGGHVGANTAFGDAAKIGAEGEARMGAALSRLTNEYPFVRVFHGLCFTPGKRGADVDHAVLIGTKVYLLDSKHWAYGDYHWDPSGVVLRNNMMFSGSEVNMGAALQKWRQYLGRNASSVESNLVLTKKNKNQYSINNNFIPAEGLPITTVDDVIGFLRNQASRTEPMVDRHLLFMIGTQIQ